MDSKKRKKIEAAGYAVTDAYDWLGLNAEERALVDMRLALTREVERLRKDKKLTQQELADKLGTKQPGIARMLGNPEASTLDSLIRALLRLGATPKRIAALF